MKWPSNTSLTLLPYLFVAYVATLRITASHPHNLIPVFSCLLLFGAVRPWREFPLVLLGLIGVDVFLTTNRYGYFVTVDHVVTWTWYLGVLLVGARLVGNALSVPRAMTASLAASVSFFLASNFAVWAVWGMYPKTWAGLGACYVAAVPFFRNSIVSETLCTAVVICVARYSERLTPAIRVRQGC